MFGQRLFSTGWVDIPSQVGSHWYGGIEGNIRGDWDVCREPTIRGFAIRGLVGPTKQL